MRRRAGQRHGHGGHGRMMIACCVPMLAIAGIPVATGVVRPFFPIFAVGCTLMMAMMMGRRGGGDGDPILPLVNGHLLR